MIGAIEAGGTKFVCAVGDASGKIFERTSFPTTTPSETLMCVEDFFFQHEIEKIGVGTFGPVDLEKGSPTYGTIQNTPKTAWRDFPLLKELEKVFEVPVYIDTDVNAACLGEYKHGAGKDAGSCLYITVGTGIGAGLVQNGQVFQGKNHSEMGHMLIPKHPNDGFEGACPSHGACLEGLASGPAIEQRYGEKGIDLTDREDVWEMEAFYLAEAIMNYYVVLSPEKVIIGGGVMKQEKLYDMVRTKFMELLNGYLTVENVDELIVAPGLDDNQGVLGAIALTME